MTIEEVLCYEEPKLRSFLFDHYGCCSLPDKHEINQNASSYALLSKNYTYPYYKNSTVLSKACTNFINKANSQTVDLEQVKAFCFHQDRFTLPTEFITQITSEKFWELFTLDLKQAYPWNKPICTQYNVAFVHAPIFPYCFADMDIQIQKEYIDNHKDDIVKKVIEALKCTTDPLPVCKIPELIVYDVIKAVGDKDLQWKIVDEFGLLWRCLLIETENLINDKLEPIKKDIEKASDEDKQALQQKLETTHTEIKEEIETKIKSDRSSHLVSILDKRAEPITHLPYKETLRTNPLLIMGVDKEAFRLSNCRKRAKDYHKRYRSRLQALMLSILRVDDKDLELMFNFICKLEMITKRNEQQKEVIEENWITYKAKRLFFIRILGIKDEALRVRLFEKMHLGETAYLNLKLKSVMVNKLKKLLTEKKYREIMQEYCDADKAPGPDFYQSLTFYERFFLSDKEDTSTQAEAEDAELMIQIIDMELEILEELRDPSDQIEKLKQNLEYLKGKLAPVDQKDQGGFFSQVGQTILTGFALVKRGAELVKEKLNIYDLSTPRAIHERYTECHKHNGGFPSEFYFLTDIDVARIMQYPPSICGLSIGLPDFNIHNPCMTELINGLDNSLLELDPIETDRTLNWLMMYDNWTWNYVLLETENPRVAIYCLNKGRNALGTRVGEIIMQGLEKVSDTKTLGKSGNFSKFLADHAELLQLAISRSKDKSKFEEEFLSYIFNQLKIHPEKLTSLLKWINKPDFAGLYNKIKEKYEPRSTASVERSIPKAPNPTPASGNPTGTVSSKSRTGDSSDTAVSNQAKQGNTIPQTADIGTGATSTNGDRATSDNIAESKATGEDGVSIKPPAAHHTDSTAIPHPDTPSVPQKPGVDAPVPNTSTPSPTTTLSTSPAILIFTTLAILAFAIALAFVLLKYFKTRTPTNNTPPTDRTTNFKKNLTAS